jgi:hypothetical protein
VNALALAGAFALGLVAGVGLVWCIGYRLAGYSAAIPPDFIHPAPRRGLAARLGRRGACGAPAAVEAAHVRIVIEGPGPALYDQDDPGSRIEWERIGQTGTD